MLIAQMDSEATDENRPETSSLTSSLQMPSISSLQGATPQSDRSNRRAFLSAVFAGSAVSVISAATLLLRAPTNALTTLLGSIHDRQARAIFDGHLDMRRPDLAIEAFDIDGKYHTYFGIWPTLLRMPVLAVTHRFDGNLTGVSIMLALIVALCATASLQYQLMTIDRRPALAHCKIASARWWMLAGMQTLVGTGTVVAFLASRPMVYHEMEMWGIAGALAVAALTLRYLARSSVQRAIALSGAVTVTLLSRPSVGLGAVASLVVVISVAILRRHGVARIGTLIVGMVCALGIYGGVNVARFGGPFSLPLERQVFSASDPQRQAVLAANDGSLFAAKYAPTTLFQYLRPDALRFDDQFPWVNFPAHRARVIGRDVIFDTLDRSSSLTASMTGLCLLGGFGALYVGKRRGRLHPATNSMALAVAVGGAVGSVAVFTIAYVAQRYLSDLLAPLVVFAIIGAQRMVERSLKWAARAVAALCIVGIWINLGLAIVYQRDPKCGDPDYGRGTTQTVCLVNSKSN